LLHFFPHVESHARNAIYNVFPATTVLSTLHAHGDSVWNSEALMEQ
jgi:hypothetical protein